MRELIQEAFTLIENLPAEHLQIISEVLKWDSEKKAAFLFASQFLSDEDKHE